MLQTLRAMDIVVLTIPLSSHSSKSQRILEGSLPGAVNLSSQKYLLRCSMAYQRIFTQLKRLIMNKVSHNSKVVNQG